MLMKKPVIQPIHQYFATKDTRNHLGGITLRILNSHIGTRTRNNSTALKAQLRNRTMLSRAIPRNGM